MAQTTENSRMLLRVRRFLQHGQECGIAAAASIANYYDPDIEYSEVRKLVAENSKVCGLYVPEQAMLLNTLGYAKITIVTNDLEMFDYSWNRFSNSGIISRLKKVKQYFHRRGNYDYASLAGHYVKWLTNGECENSIKIDHDFAKYIRRHLRSGKPIGGMINWNALHRCAKSKTRSVVGQADFHSIVIRGCDDNSVFIVDSDSFKNKNGYYKIKWSQFLTMAYDLTLVG